MEDDEPTSVDDGDRRRQIERLEDRIEQLAETIERCRKLVLIAKAAVAVGTLVIVAVLAGMIRFDTALIASLAAVIGGFVAIGANGSTADEAAAALAAAESERDELINAIAPQVVGGRASDGPVAGIAEDAALAAMRRRGNGRILP
jgi:hypothetical protein